MLRAVEPRDIDLLYNVENDLNNWSVSGTNAPFSVYILERFIETQSQDIFANRQLRLMIESCEGDVVGILDLFDFDPYNHRAGVGILIFESSRGVGYGGDALLALHGYCSDVLHLHQLWCDVGADNLASIKLFERSGYKRIGIKQGWQFRCGEYRDEIMYQKIL